MPVNSKDLGQDGLLSVIDNHKIGSACLAGFIQLVTGPLMEGLPAHTVTLSHPGKAQFFGGSHYDDLIKMPIMTAFKQDSRFLDYIGRMVLFIDPLPEILANPGMNDGIESLKVRLIAKYLLRQLLPVDLPIGGEHLLAKGIYDLFEDILPFQHLPAGIVGQVDRDPQFIKDSCHGAFPAANIAAKSNK